MAERLHPAALVGRRVLWLLDLQWAGQTIRLSDADVEVTDEDGETHSYIGRLEDVTVKEQLDFLADASASPTSAAIEAVLPVDVPELVARGYDPATATGELSRWVEGTTYEARRVVVRGQVVDPQHGEDWEPMRFSVEATPWTDARVLPDPDWSVRGANWDTAMIASLPGSGVGLPYPLVFGQPGRVSESVFASGLLTGSQAVYVDQRRTLHSTQYAEVTPVLMYGHTGLSSIYLKTSTAKTFLRYKVLNSFDRSGHPVTIAPWWGTKSPASTDDYEYDGTASYTWIAPTTTVAGSIGQTTAPASIQPGVGEEPVGTYACWYDPDNPTAGGYIGPDGQPIRGAGAVLRELLRLSGQEVDNGRFAAAARLLDRFKLDFVIDAQEGVTAWDFAVANILPILPVSIVSGPNGYYPIVWRYDATERDAQFHLHVDDDPNTQRTSKVTYDRSEVRNDFSLDYAYSTRMGRFYGRIRYAADTEGGAVPSLLCKLSQRRYLRPDGSPIVAQRVEESIVVYSDATAHAVLQWMTAAYCFARRRVRYAMNESQWGWLERGMVGQLSDASMRFDGLLVVVESIETDGSGSIEVGFLVIESPVRDARLIG